VIDIKLSDTHLTTFPNMSKNLVNLKIRECANLKIDTSCFKFTVADNMVSNHLTPLRHYLFKELQVITAFHNTNNTSEDV